MKNIYPILFFCLCGISICISCKKQVSHGPPNVIVVITDDQGYGDLSAHGNPWLKTPNLDILHGESLRLTNFHVGTTCAPSRSSVMTGKYCNNAGAWHTIQGRQMVWADERMISENFQQAGYTTGMFGKWHLGDNYPYRPQDRGFQEVLMHGGGGVGQTPDYWNNDYFDDTYFRNGEPEKHEGYCTDVWFREAMSFIEANKDGPFFCYLATNAPHGPFHVDTAYSKVYEQMDGVVNANFFGMIANIDENIGLLREKLTKLNIADNTIFVFLTDNGTAAGCNLKDGFVSEGYNAGMRGKKGSEYEGGHRVPCFIHWKNGNLNIGRDIDELTGAIDLGPTLLELCGISPDPEQEFDGISLKPLIDQSGEWGDRILFADTQREDSLIKYRRFCVMNGDWRLVNGELYNLRQDPEQKNNLAGEHSFMAANLMAAYENWWAHVSRRKDEYCYVPLGSQAGPQGFTHHDLHPETEGYPAWHQAHIRSAKMLQGFWAVEVQESGEYRFELQRWPKEANLEILSSAPEGDMIPQGLAFKQGTPIDIVKAHLEIGEQKMETTVSEGDKAAVFTLSLDPGTYELRAEFEYADGQENGAYYVYAEKGK
ncbi:MAG: arylsulfatase [Bacteroidota bacterium]